MTALQVLPARQRAVLILRDVLGYPAAEVAEILDQPAFGAYLRPPTGGRRHGAGLFVFTLTGDRISAVTRFDNSVLACFGLPLSLPD